LTRFSIITPSYNQAQFIGQTIESVLTQSHPPAEYLIFDGGSTDGSRAIIGQADAVNKGFRAATGDIFGWLNSDDYYTPGALKTVADYFAANPQAMFVYGDALAIDAKGRRFGRRANVGHCNLETLLRVGDPIVQPAAFWRRQVWQQAGDLLVGLHFTLDYEYWIRIAKRGYLLHYLPVCLAVERLYGAAKTFRDPLPRMAEMAQMIGNHGGEGLPLHFRPEAAAYHWWAAKNAPTSGVRGLHQQQYKALRAGGDRRFWGKFALYWLTLRLGGAGQVVGLRLWSNRLRGGRVTMPEA
jgi:glycosyltransferase involved in cell wall biosynthesis